jgi:hypothetical protein
MFSDIEVKQTLRPELESNEYIKDMEAYRHGNEEVASDNTMCMIPEERRPALILSVTRARRCPMYFLTVRGESRVWSFSQGSSAIRSSPQVRFSAAIQRIKRLASADITGRPAGFDFQHQKRRKAARCQPIDVAGLTMTKALRQSKRRPSLHNAISR